MKKLLTVLGAIGLIATTGTSVVACGEQETKLGKLSQEELQEKFDNFLKNSIELQDKLDKADEGSEEYLKLEDELNKNSFGMNSFIADIFLETKYTFDFGQEEHKILEEKDEWVYQLLLEKSVLSFKSILDEMDEQTPEWNEKYSIYINDFKEDLAKLTRKAKIEDLSKFKLEELNQKFDNFKKNMSDLIDQNDKWNEENGTNYPAPIENPNLKDQWIKNYFSEYCFIAKIFLETKYAVNINNNGENLKIEEKVEPEYQEWMKELRLQLSDEEPLKGNQHYIDIFGKYALELLKKSEMN